MTYRPLIHGLPPTHLSTARPPILGCRICARSVKIVWMDLTKGRTVMRRPTKASAVIFVTAIGFALISVAWMPTAYAQDERPRTNPPEISINKQGAFDAKKKNCNAKCGDPFKIKLGTDPSYAAQVTTCWNDCMGITTAKCAQLLAAYKSSLINGTGIQQNALREQLSVLCGYSP
jgi:hypothetical protein